MKLEEKVGELLKAKKLSLSTAESCTGGGIAALITSVPGSSEYFNGSIVAYSNEIKMFLLHVSAETLEKHGAVSEETVIEIRFCSGYFRYCRSWRWDSGKTGGYGVDSRCL